MMKKSLFLIDINKDETILNAAITMTKIKIINITLFSLFIARKSDWYDWVQSFAYIVAYLLLKVLVNSSASRGSDNWMRTSEIGKSEGDNFEFKELNLKSEILSFKDIKSKIINR